MDENVSRKALLFDVNAQEKKLSEKDEKQKLKVKIRLVWLRKESAIYSDKRVQNNDMRLSLSNLRSVA